VGLPLAGLNGTMVAVSLTWIEILGLSIVLCAAASIVILGPRACIEVLGVKALRKIIHG
jgi:hypothetical protein